MQRMDSDRSGAELGSERTGAAGRAGFNNRRQLPSLGARIGQYELVRELGRGGMGAVFLARDTRLGRRVAIKVILGEKSELTARFLQEAQTTAQCEHENIVVIHDVGEHQGNPFMVLEYLRGAPLSQHLTAGKNMSPARAVEFIIPVIRALERAHEHGIVHRDLKPDNIFVTESGTIKVLDFGIAKLIQQKPTLFAERSHSPVIAHATIGPFPTGERDAPTDNNASSLSHQTKQGALVGTLPYMSPEQWGADGVDHRTDIWAIGIILFEMLAGRHPLAPKRGWELVVTGVVEQPMPGLEASCPAVSADLAAIVDRCLEKRKDRRFDSARELLEALEPLSAHRTVRRLQPDQSPYTGLDAFQEKDAQRFFGRAPEIAEAVARLRSQPLMAIVGPSGVGKSSFVRAGLVPALKQSGTAWVAEVIRPGRNPMAALAHLLTSVISMASTTDLRNDLAQHENALQRLRTEPGFLGTVLRGYARAESRRILVFIDQFEELYTLGADESERRAFTACLASIADDATTPLRVVLSIRSDFLDRVPEDRYFMAELTQGLFFLTPPGRDGLREALMQPAEMARYRFESESTVEHMLDHLEHMPGALPLLQFAASKLWETRDRERKLLTEAAYHALGGIAGALASHADAVLAESSARARQLIRAVFLRLVTPERTRAIVTTRELFELAVDASAVERVLDHLSGARLLVIQTDERDGSASVELVHESLIHSWPRLRRWLDENQEHAAFLEQLRTAAKQWQAKGYPAGLLWRGEAMEEARRWRRHYLGELPALHNAYLNAVIALAARSERRLRWAVAGVIGVLCLLVAAAGVALVQIREAQEQATVKAEQASRAEFKAQQQLEAVLAEQELRKRAENQAQTAQREVAEKREALVEADHALAQANIDLQQKNAALASTLLRARSEAGRAERESQRARRNEAEALAAKRKADQLNARLQRRLDAEKQRNQQLAAQLSLIIENFEVVEP